MFRLLVLVELSKKHKVYAGVLGLGLMALVLDKMIPGPSQAQATGVDYAVDPVLASPPAGSEQSNPLTGLGVGDVRAIAFADRLGGLGARDGLNRDDIKEAFDPERVRIALRAARGMVNSDSLLDARAFSVTSIMSGARPAAVINGTLCFVGEIVPDGGEPAAGYRLIEIGAKRVILDLNGHRIELLRPEIEKPSDKGNTDQPKGLAKDPVAGLSEKPSLGGP